MRFRELWGWRLWGWECGRASDLCVGLQGLWECFLLLFSVKHFVLHVLYEKRFINKV